MQTLPVNIKLLTSVLGVAAILVVLVFLFLPAPESTKSVPPPSTQNKADAQHAGYADDFGSETALPSALPQQALAAQPAGVSWEDRLDQLLTNDADSATTVRGLVSSMRGLPAAAQEEYAAHAVNLCEDEQFLMFNEVYLNAAAPREVKEIIFNDALNRPDEIKLPFLVQTLEKPAHPMAGEAKEILEMYLDLEPGATPPGGWDQAVKKYLTEQSAP